MRVVALWHANYLSHWISTQAMTDATATTITPAPSAAPSSAAGGGPSGASAPSPSPLTSPDTGLIKIAETSTEPAVTAAPAKAARPEWLPADYWDDEKGAAKSDTLTERLKEADDFRAARAAVPKTAGEYKPVLPKDLPAEISINTSDPLFKAAQEFAHKTGMPQEQFSELLGMEARRQLAQHKAARDYAAQRDAALGPDGPARVDAIVAFQKATAPNDQVAGELAKMLVTPGIIGWFEDMQRAMTAQGVAPLTRAGKDGVAPKGKIAGYEKMSFAEQMLAGGHV